MITPSWGTAYSQISHNIWTSNGVNYVKSMEQSKCQLLSKLVEFIRNLVTRYELYQRILLSKIIINTISISAVEGD